MQVLPGCRKPCTGRDRPDVMHDGPSMTSGGALGDVGAKSSRNGCRQQLMPSGSRIDLSRKIQPATTTAVVLYAD